MKVGDLIESPLGRAEILRIESEADLTRGPKQVRGQAYAFVKLERNGEQRIYWIYELTETEESPKRAAAVPPEAKNPQIPKKEES